jgi:hypothetical protein
LLTSRGTCLATAEPRLANGASRGSFHDVGLAIAVVVLSFVTIAWPFAVATYPPMTDLPFHAAQTSAFRHYFDPSFHFRDQFELTPLRVPYLSSYVLGAVLMLVLPAAQAVKLATIAMLSLVPIGLATLFWGMRRSPLLAISALPIVWCDLTHWGFINFMAAIGLYAAALGMTLRLLEKPTLRLQFSLAAILLLLFFTHIFRYPLAVAGVIGCALAMFPIRRRLRCIALPIAPSLAAFVAFRATVPASLSGSFGSLTIDTSRLDSMPDFIVHGFNDPKEWEAFRVWLCVVALYACVTLPFAVRSFQRASRDERRFRLLVTLVPLGSAAAFFLLYLVLPMEIGLWWYVFPREAVSSAFMLLGLLPALPQQPIARVASVIALLLSALGVTRVVARHYAAFEAVTADFRRIITRIPKAPRLLYLVFDHAGTHRTNTPFIHLPAYVQADRGGFLSFHFAVWDASPLRYRDPQEEGATVPPPVPLRWEWTPERFDVETHGWFFDWFLVRRLDDPRTLFANDPTVRYVAHDGTWWLYRRVGSRPPPPTVERVDD